MPCPSTGAPRSLSSAGSAGPGSTAPVTLVDLLAAVSSVWDCLSEAGLSDVTIVETVVEASETIVIESQHP